MPDVRCSIASHHCCHLTCCLPFSIDHEPLNHPMLKHIDFQVPSFGEFVAGPQTLLSYANEVLADGPVAYFRLGEASGSVAANEVGMTHGSFIGGVSLNQSGALMFDSDAAVALDGSNARIDTNLDDALDILGDITIEAWIRADDLNSTYHIASKNDAGGPTAKCPWQFALVTGGTLRWFAADNAGGFNEARDSTQSISVLAWHHVALVVDSQQVTFYIDGQQDGGGWQSFSGSPAASAVTGKIGCRGDATTQFFPGRIDEFAVFDHALSAARLAAHYRAGVAR